MSDSGEISWTSDNESESFVDLALDTPVKIPMYRGRKKKQARCNLSNLNVTLVAPSTPNNPTSPVLGTGGKAKNGSKSPILKSKRRAILSVITDLPDVNNEITTMKSAYIDPPSPILKPVNNCNKKPPVSPLLTLHHSRSSEYNENGKYAFTTQLKAIPLSDNGLEVNRNSSNVKSPVISNSRVLKNHKSPIISSKNATSSSKSFRKKLEFIESKTVKSHSKNFNTISDILNKTTDNAQTLTQASKTSNEKCKINTKANVTANTQINLIETLKINQKSPTVTSHSSSSRRKEMSKENELLTISKNYSASTKLKKLFNSIAEGTVTNTSIRNKKRCISDDSNDPNISSQTPDEKYTPSNIQIPLEISMDVKKSMNDNKISPDTSKTSEKHSPVLSLRRPLPDLISPPDESIVKKIKYYFDSHFSSHSNTQVSICDSTPKSQKPTDSEGRITTQIDITESNSPIVTQESFKISSEKSTSSIPESSNCVVIKNEVDESAPKRRRKYKKDGLAGRLQLLLKKQRNQLYLWQHEMYLASNSNFIVPNSKTFRLFGIKKISPEYGCHLIEAVDLSDDREYTIFLNTYFSSNITVSEKMFLKLYEPFEFIESVAGTAIINACKFECLTTKEEK